jgi:D-alanine-D-alanine ligase
MELNPLAGLHPEHSDLPIICTAAGISYDELIGFILDSAVARIEPVNPNRKAASLAGGHPAQPRAGASGA